MGSVCGRYYAPTCGQSVTFNSFDKVMQQKKQNEVHLPDVKMKDQTMMTLTSQPVSGMDTSIQEYLGGQVGQDELVLAASSHNWYSHDYIHTTVCRYCREEANGCFYENHLVNYLESNKCGQGNCLIVDKMVQVTSSSDNGFIVNCVAVQETCTYFD